MKVLEKLVCPYDHQHQHQGRECGPETCVDVPLRLHCALQAELRGAKKAQDRIQDRIQAITGFIRTIPFSGMDAEVAIRDHVVRTLDGTVTAVHRLPELRRWPVRRSWDVVFVPDGAPQVALDFQRGSAAAITVHAVNIHTAPHSRPGTIYVNNSLTPEQQLHALLHEVGHILTRPWAEDLGLLGWEAAAEAFALQVLERWGISPGLQKHNLEAFEYTFQARGQRRKVNKKTVNKAVSAALEKFAAAD